MTDPFNDFFEPFEWTRKMRFLFWLGKHIGNIRYRLGLTHQFHCQECGWPMMERYDGHYWHWLCSNSDCGFERPCRHAPQVLKRQHRVVAHLRVIWKESQVRHQQANAEFQGLLANRLYEAGKRRQR